MQFDWINIVATFGAAIAGSWFGARATNKQSNINLAIAKHQWEREKAFELLSLVDEYVNYSFRKETLSLPDRDHLSKKLLALTAVVIPNDVLSVSEYVKEIRKLHTGQLCSKRYSETEEFFEQIRIKLFAIARKNTLTEI